MEDLLTHDKFGNAFRKIALNLTNNHGETAKDLATSSMMRALLEGEMTQSMRIVWYDSISMHCKLRKLVTDRMDYSPPLLMTSAYNFFDGVAPQTTSSIGNSNHHLMPKIQQRFIANLHIAYAMNMTPLSLKGHHTYGNNTHAHPRQTNDTGLSTELAKCSLFERIMHTDCYRPPLCPATRSYGSKVADAASGNVTNHDMLYHLNSQSLLRLQSKQGTLSIFVMHLVAVGAGT